MFRFLKTTILGGVLFLVPIVIFIAVIGRALQLTHKLATPIAAKFPLASVGGLAVVELVALAILVLICFIAGLAARTRSAHRLVQTLEANVLDKMPAYALMKAKTDGKSLIFLPGAPDPWSGSICAVTMDRLHPLQLNIREVGILMKRLGKGYGEALREPLGASSPRSKPS